MTSLPLSETLSDTLKKQKTSLGAQLKDVLKKRSSSSSDTNTPQDPCWQLSETLETLGLQGFDNSDLIPLTSLLSAASLHQELPSSSLELGTGLETLWMPFRWLQGLEVLTGINPDIPHQQEAVEGEQGDEVQYWQAVTRVASRLKQRGATCLPRHSPVVPNPIWLTPQSLAKFLNAPDSPFQKPATPDSEPDS
ncbi:uncharacterized protein BT62DRAFT_1001697 [Guyanagaster necrorhizus]|uniref:Uncharacterized protein n=1 Tax=Guyanagaster necrorhizus TaxID=856835 RepID=A0A9P7W1G0_9AGAR|nr:uncharacterized protein BT62DRAFT_1001697 [Guyanagaster necrorhizus MCA 3950]KAG7450857.1 hypothetical protein BT62DRAFT_1001697 [Guyanagaster necrorhizus MCA 3950]